MELKNPHRLQLLKSFAAALLSAKVVPGFPLWGTENFFVSSSVVHTGHSALLNLSGDDGHDICTRCATVTVLAHALELSMLQACFYILSAPFALPFVI